MRCPAAVNQRRDPFAACPGPRVTSGQATCSRCKTLEARIAALEAAVRASRTHRGRTGHHRATRYRVSSSRPFV